MSVGLLARTNVFRSHVEGDDVDDVDDVDDG